MTHIPVLLHEVLTALIPAENPPPERVLDGTLGAGGHTAALLEQGTAAVLGLDVDPHAIELACKNLEPYGERVHIIQASYADMGSAALQMGWQQVDGILLDLGVSSMQLDEAERGFAFMQDGPLDMRFDPGGNHPTAEELVNYLDETELSIIFQKYGEEHYSRPLARTIIAQRPYHTTRQLAEVIEAATPAHKRQGIHPATRVFQALRIAVNDELGTIERGLEAALELLAPGGRLAVISFHSLEDRIVKQTFKLASTDCICPPKVPVCVCGHHASVRLVNRKPIAAAAEEIAQNPRSRSAKLRVVEKL